MNITDLAYKVAQVRQLQQSYFKTKDGHTLTKCKKAERELDEMVAAILPKPIGKDDQK